MNRLKKYLDYLVIWLRKMVYSANFNGVVIGISGGIDSAVVALLAKKAFPKDYLTINLPCHSQREDDKYIDLLIKTHKLKNIKINLNSVYNKLIKQIPIKNLSKPSLMNIKPRLRMTTIYAIAQTYNYLVLGTNNADEWYVGYFTKYGDNGVDLEPIVYLLKNDVVKAAKLLGVNKKIIHRTPTAGLWNNQTDECDLGFSYKILDKYLNNEKIPIEIQKKIENLHKLSIHKRKRAFIPYKKLRRFNKKWV